MSSEFPAGIPLIFCEDILLSPEIPQEFKEFVQEFQQGISGTVFPRSFSKFF